MLSRVFLFVILIFSCSPVEAAYDFTKLTKTESLRIIDSLKKSDLRSIEKKFLTDSFLFRQRIFIDLHGIYYVKYYFPNGQLRSEGLCDYRNTGPDFMDEYREWESNALLEISRIGTWIFYDRKGKPRLEYDYSTRTQIQLEKKVPATNADLEKVRSNAEDFFVTHFGKDFYDKHIRLSPFISWAPAGRCGGKNYISYPIRFESGDFELCTPDLPLMHASGYQMNVQFVFEDTIIADEKRLTFDSSLTLLQVGIYDAADYKFQCVTVEYNTALQRAAANGFLPPLRFEWNKYGCYWKSSNRAPDVNAPSFSMDVCSGVVWLNQLIVMNDEILRARFCETDFHEDCDAAGVIADGLKRLDFGDYTIDVPDQWLRTDIRHGSMLNTIYISDGIDTLEMNPSCVTRARLDHVNDIYDNISMSAFLDHFNDARMQGRDVYCKIIRMNILFQITISFHEEEGPEYSFFSTVSDAGKRDEILEMLETIHFKKCPE